MRAPDIVYNKRYKVIHTINGKHHNIHLRTFPLSSSTTPPYPLPLSLPSTFPSPSSPYSLLFPFLPIPLLSPSNLAESNPVGGLVHLLRVQDVFYTLFVWKTSVCQFSGLQSTIASTELRECHVLRESCMVWVCGVVYMCVCVL